MDRQVKVKVQGSDDPIPVVLSEDMDQDTREKLLPAAIAADPDQNFWSRIVDDKGNAHEVVSSAKDARDRKDEILKTYAHGGVDENGDVIPETVQLKAPGSDRMFTVARDPQMSEKDWADLKDVADSSRFKTDIGPVTVVPSKTAPPRAPIAERQSGGGGFFGGIRRMVGRAVTQAMPGAANANANTNADQPPSQSPDQPANPFEGIPQGTDLSKYGTSLEQLSHMSPANRADTLRTIRELFARDQGFQKIIPTPSPLPVDPGLAAAAKQAGIQSPPPSTGDEAPAAPPAYDPGDISTYAAPPPGASPSTAPYMGGGGPRLGPSSMDTVAPGVQQTMDQQSQALQDAGELEAQKLYTVGRLRQQATQNSLDSAASMLHIQEIRRGEQQDALRAVQDTANEMSKVVPVDPNAYWNNKSTGQKILAAASIFLGGLGQGAYAAAGIKTDNEALGIMKDAIRQDVETRRFNATNQRESLANTLTGQKAVFDMLREKGMDEFEALKAEHALKTEAAAQQIEGIAQQMGAPEAIAKAQAAAGAVRAEGQKLLMEVAQHRDRYALGRAKLELGYAGLATRKAALGAALKGGDVVKEAQFRSALGSLKQLEGLQGQSMPVAGRVAKFVPGTDSKHYQDMRNAFFEQLGPLLKGGVLRQTDVKRMQDLFPVAGEMDAGSKFRALHRLLITRYLEDQRGFAAAGVTRGLIAPDMGEEDDDLGFE